MTNKWQTGIATHEGTKKDKNEDSYLSLITEDNQGDQIALFVVADGMGGYQVGDIASDIAINSLKLWWNKRIHKILKKKDVMTRLLLEGENVLQKINQTIITTSDHQGKKMGTTVSLLVLYKGKYAVIHIGDSRIYQMKDWHYGLQQYFHNGNNKSQLSLQSLNQQNTEILESDPNLYMLTEDHSWVEKQVKEEKLTKEQARNHPKRNVLTQCLGIEKTIKPYVQSGKYQSSDLFLVCSDGFHSLFSNDEIKNMLVNLEKEYGNLQAMCDYLINFSNFSEAHDNITLLLIRNLYVEKRQEKTKNSFFSFLNFS